MLSYDDALARILSATPSPLPAEAVALEETLGRALANDVIADADLPPFDNSAVDGYALPGEAAGSNEWQVSQEIRAGETAMLEPLSENQAAAIYTGAPLPPGADRVVMVEDTDRLSEDRVRILAPGKPGDHIRRAGSDIPRGAVAAVRGTTIDPGLVGLLASLNRATIDCPRVPRVGLLATGDELIPVGEQTLKPGQIRNSNAPALAAAVRAAGGVVAGRQYAKDTPDAVRQALEALSDCDVIVSSGGVSVGGHDYVKAVVEEIGSLDFWRIAIKPGKPLAFGRIGGALFFGLPGNPVSSLVTFELFVRPVLRRMAGHTDILHRRISVELSAPLPHNRGRREFARARLTVSDEKSGGLLTAIPLGLQDSHRLSSLGGADALLIAHEDHGDYAAGDRLPALLLT